MDAGISPWLMKESTLARKRAQGLCIVPRCSKRAGPKKTRCNMHHSRMETEREPLRPAYRKKKHDAKRRRIWFDPALTFPVFKAWALSSGYAAGRGSDGESLTIHRKNNRVGYTLSNLEPLTRIENSIIGTHTDVNDDPF